MTRSRRASASTADELRTRPPLTPDAIVVGAGICGASAAFYLRQHGLDVLLLDRAGVATGSTGLGEGNVLLSDKRPGPEYQLALVGRELGERFPEARVTAKGALVLEHGDGGRASESEPELAPGVRCRLEPGDLQVDAAGLTRAFAAAVRCRSGADVVAVEPHGVRLRSGERLACDHVVIATGAWAGELTPLPVRPRKGQLVALAAPPGLIRHKLLEAAYADAAAATDPGLAIATVIEQTLAGDEVLVGSSRESVGFDGTVREDVSRAMLSRAARFVPALRTLPVARAWCGFRPWLPDGLPAIGPLDDRGGLWVTMGHEGSGVGLGPISGLILAQMIAGVSPGCDPTPFDPRRFEGQSVHAEG
jgi:D-hydroxyproline dehydrogenase subunit beta